jgi:hypothetical protein
MDSWLRCERAQGTVEYVGLVLLVALLMAALVAATGVNVPGAGLARTLAGKLVCAVKGGERCAGVERLELAAAYGGELAGSLRRNVPEIRFERDEFVSLPVDFRTCRDRSCADTSVTGTVRRSYEGTPPTAFTRVVDCRGPEPPDDVDCSGARAGNVYLQFWLYYPDSATRPLGRFGYHRDDWESFQVRIGPDGSRVARASSHAGYNPGRPGLRNILSDTGHSSSPRWGPGLGFLHVAAGSHAGAPVYDGDDAWRIPRHALRLVPLEPILAELDTHTFEVAPPWHKRVWRDPESPETG